MRDESASGETTGNGRRGRVPRLPREPSRRRSIAWSVARRRACRRRARAAGGTGPHPSNGRAPAGGRLGWPARPWDDQLVFVFDAGTVTPDRAAGLRPADYELAAVEFVTPEEAAGRLRADMARRLARALRALRDGDTGYDVHSHQ